MSATSQNASTSYASETRDTRKNVALGMIGGAFVGIVGLTAPFVAMQLRSSLPYMATPRRKVERALQFLSQRSEAASRKKQLSNSSRRGRRPIEATNRERRLTFVDLGSGDGTTILAAASLGWNATGLELNPTLWLVSSLRRMFSPRTIRSNSQLVLGDMFESGVASRRLRGADCVMIFGVKALMPRIADLVQRECAPGCVLVSYRFRVPLVAEGRIDGDVNHHAEENSTSSGSVHATLIYDEEEMRIYELTKSNEDGLPISSS